MARPQEHLAEALEALKAIQDKGVVAIRAPSRRKPHGAKTVPGPLPQSPQ